jgi:hypothetical protein
MHLRQLAFLRLAVSKRAVSVFVLLFLFVLFSFWLVREPRYKGISLSDWLDSYPHNSAETEQEVRNIGRAAFPSLMRMLRTKQPQNIIASSLNNLGFHVNNSAFSRRERLLAVRGISILGSDAAPLLPKLHEMISDPECGPEIAEAVRAIGPKARPEVDWCLTSTNAVIKRNAVRALRSSSGPEAAKELFALSTNADPVIRAEVFLCLPGHVPQFGDRVLQTILNGCDDPDVDAQCRAIVATHAIGDIGTNALPKLYSLASSRNGRVSAEARIAIKALERRMRLAKPVKPL